MARSTSACTMASGSFPCWRRDVKTEPVSGSISQSLGKITAQRSEEHTSELQSPCNLVCRLLLEKKKTLSCAPYAKKAHIPPPTFFVPLCCLFFSLHFISHLSGSCDTPPSSVDAGLILTLPHAY